MNGKVIVGGVAAVVATGVYWFFFAGPSKRDVERARIALIGIVCETDIVAQDVKLQNDVKRMGNSTLNDLMKNAQASAQTMATALEGMRNTAAPGLAASGLGKSKWKSIASQKKTRTALLVQSVTLEAAQKCPTKARPAENVTDAVTAILVMIEKGTLY